MPDSIVNIKKIHDECMALTGKHSLREYSALLHIIKELRQLRNELKRRKSNGIEEGQKDNNRSHNKVGRPKKIRPNNENQTKEISD